VEKAVNGEALNVDEAQLLGDAPKLTQSLLARIPRLENVGAILAHASRATAGREPPAPAIAERALILMNVLEFDALTSIGESAETAIATLRARGGAKSAPLLAQLAALQGMVDSGPELREMRLCEVLPGMIIMDDVRTDLGTLLVSRGYEVSQSFVLRMRNLSPRLLEERVRVRRSALVGYDSTDKERT
jgi:hypothetical protein